MCVGFILTKGKKRNTCHPKRGGTVCAPSHQTSPNTCMSRCWSLVSVRTGPYATGSHYAKVLIELLPLWPLLQRHNLKFLFKEEYPVHRVPGRCAITLPVAHRQAIVLCKTRSVHKGDVSWLADKGGVRWKRTDIQNHYFNSETDSDPPSTTTEAKPQLG